MFWGLIMDPNKRYTQTVEKAFHVSMASLDTIAAGNNIVQVKLCYEGLNYLLCSLEKGKTWQVPLDLNFQEGTEISFTSNDKVHLTGYLIPEDSMDMGDLEDEEDEEEEEEEEDEEVPQLVGKQAKRKAPESPKDSKKLKKLKAALQQDELSSDDDDDDDDLDESLEVEGEDDSDDLEDDAEAGEEEEDDSEEEEVEVKPQQKKQKQKEQQQQQQANKKQEKQKLVNGKSTTPEQTKAEKKKGKGEQQPQQQKKAKGEQQQQQQQNNAQQAQKKRVLEGGVQVEDVKVGNGPNAKAGKFIAVHYVGRLSNGKKFDSTTQGEGFKFRLGKGEVIKGWDVGIAGMKVGGKRRITIPPGMAYGAKGSGSVIPGNSTLVFEVELKNVH